MRNKSTQAVYELIKRDRRVLAVTADNRNEIYDDIRKNYPNQYIEYGIAEENMVASCAGLATCGYIPFLYTITNFLSMRAFEFIRNDVCIGNRNVKFLGRSSGLVSCSMGATHQGTEELALLRTLPNLLVITPSTPVQAREATKYAYQFEGPVYIRLEGSNEPELYNEKYNFDSWGCIRIKTGKDVSIFSIGSIINQAVSVANRLEKQGISADVVDVPVVKPIDEKLIIESIRKTKKVITIEEHSVYGGLGTVIAEVIAINNLSCDFKMMGLNGCAVGCGNRKDMRELNGISEEDLYCNCIKMVNK